MRPCLDDYSEQERQSLLNAGRIFFPTPKYADVFHACDIPTFPSATTYRYQRSRILQQLLIHYLDLPHPHSRVYYGARQKEKILDHFELPLLVSGAANVPGATHVVRDAAELERIIHTRHCLIVRELNSWTDRIQLICVQYEIIGALRPGTGRPGARVALEPLPLNDRALTKPIRITKQLLLSSQLDDILIEWVCANGDWQFHGMGRPPVRWPTHRGTGNRHRYICDLIQSGAL